ncbi:chromosome segregation protein [Bathymodiolus japonicus methanotrophic gill symbiont]|uniref:chromosome segregation protein SMC n=1 Tax=Bathymodiolus japonicus methanotrophic gill symbiont TaxID=113269 RepID=UPI001B72686B|nr:chromosome segregation protein SMC [Bathymodiolus japonicus methanotrophic gill symbiont]GFO71242.1 chromosome segregation protein [Bathymodiolus japonicus methanotrophic gill symbiont]
MKLEKIKLSGFKSFVDATTIPITGNLISIVGPNGCGKSNIIDAVRWVMGESSAKHLRGGSMADVIFNGSSGRKPVSTASVELIFDNSEGRAGGEFAKYNTIAIKRQVSRDGQSIYMFNGTKCRRKDITDLFLGTGLGARSYAIIEQGTISRVVEAKPDELRIHIEEAAGVTKYKERRNETEMRMRHTRENLERLDDVRDEVEKQLNHLHKQAEKAEKYTTLKIQERQLKLELLAMRWRAHQQMAEQLEVKLQDAAEAHNQLFMERKELEQTLEQKRLAYKTQQQAVDKQQGEYYHVVAEVSRLDQIIKHNEQSHEEAELELARLREQAEHLNVTLDEDLRQLDEIKESLLEAEESLLVAQEREDELLEIQSVAQEQRLAWQQEWEAYKNQYANYREQAEVKRMLIAQLENQTFQMQSRLQRLQGEHDELNEKGVQEEIETLDQSIQLIEEQRDQTQIELDTVHLSITELRKQIKQYHEVLHSDRSELQTIKGKVTSLEMLQQHAMGKDNQKLTHWLDRMTLTENQRLAEFIDVEAGWDGAVETVLGTYLEAVCIDNADSVIAELSSLSDESITLFETQHSLTAEPVNGLVRLIDKIKTPWNLHGLLTGIYCAESSEQAREIMSKLKPYESVITTQGTWMGYGWVRVTHDHDAKSGVLQREKELRLLKEEQIELQARVVVTEEQLETAEEFLKQSERQREDSQQKYKQVSIELAQKNADFSAHSARVEQQQQRLAQVMNEMADINRELLDNTEAREEAVMIKEQAEEAMLALEETRLELEQNSDSLQTQSEQSDKLVNESRQQVHALQVNIASLKSSDALTTKQIERLHQQYQHARERIAELDKKLHSTLEPMDDERYQLETLQQNKDKFEQDLKQVRDQQQALEAEITESAEQYAAVQQHLEKKKELLDSIRFEQQESQVRQQTVTEQLDELEADAEKIIQTIAAHADESAWKIKVDDLARQIERLGTINLTAIEEYKAQSERMNFLNEQNADLLEALETLEQAIAKIDEESRQRFKQTFDKINSGLQEKFPKLFGGGKAYLSLTDDDLLESGVNIIAQPPGKRNSSIHLLSGGEKALTAVALVFSIFDLNPAPFCLLDEVDAPLDEANVRRFSAMVEEMSASVQFLYISHNKVTMEIAQQLAGVTMKEPGVSRMVAVDIQEAVAMAEN